MEDQFVQVGIRFVPATILKKQKWYEGKPMISITILAVIVLGSLCCDLFLQKNPSYMDLYHANAAPNSEFWFGTDTMGRDIFSMIWHGGRISLFIGFFATLISTAIAILFGSLSGLSPQWLDRLFMRLVEIFISIPSLLLVIFLQATFGKANIFTISFVIGITGWTSMSKLIRTEVRQMKNSEYLVAARCMGAGFFHILRRHLMPNFISSIMFMIVMSIRSAIIFESTLSFMGIGLPLEIISWGSMLSLSEKAMLSRAWWIILIPGVFLIVTLLCVTNIGNYLRKQFLHDS